MPILSGYSANLPTDVLLGSLVIYLNSSTAYGATQGEPTVSLPHEYENLMFDGKLTPIAGLDRRVGGPPYIEGTFIEINTTKALDLEPGGTSATVGSVTTITPKLLGEFLVIGDYKKNARAFMRRGGGGVVCVEFDYALLIVDTFAGDGGKNGTLKVRLENRQDPSASSLGVAGYTIKLADSITSITSVDI